jgi:hypothetical protein
VSGRAMFKLTATCEKPQVKVWFKLNILAGSFREILGFPKLTFSLELELLIPAGWAAIFFPDFPGAISDFGFLRLRHRAGSLFQFVSQGQYAADRFVVADPLCELTILIGRREKMVDDRLRIHGALHLNKTMDPRKCSSS